MKKKQSEYILSIDVGTQSIRAVFIDLWGNLHDLVKTPISQYVYPKPGWVEMDANIFWSTLCFTTKKLFKKSSVNKKAVRGVAITTQRSTLINLDKNGNPLRPAIIWMDTRKAKLENWPSLPLKIILKSINSLDSVTRAYKECEANWLRQNQTEIWKKTHKYLFLSGFLTYKLTEQFLDSKANIVGYIPFDYKKQEWAAKGHIVRKIFPMSRAILPELVNPSDTLGFITKKASADSGIPRGLPLIASGSDKACEILGSGSISPEIACLSFGTTATIMTTSSKYIEVIPPVPAYPSAIPGAYNTEVMVYKGFWMVNWFRKEFGFYEEMQAKKKNVTPESLFEKLIENIPAGSMGLMLQPYWSPGAKVPGPKAKGAIIGFSDVHTRGHIYKAILEGLIFALKQGAIQTEKRSKIKIQKIRISGGGSQSNSAMQISADIFGCTAEKPHTYETSSLGAAINAAVGLKFYPDLPSAIKNMTRIGESFQPIAENQDIYRKLYKNVYQKIYKQLSPLYEEIQQITGYPSL